MIALHWIKVKNRVEWMEDEESILKLLETQ